MAVLRSLGLTTPALPWRSAIYRDSFFLMTANVANAGFGFLFWTAAARLYQSREVGFAAAVISAVGLLAMLAVLGLDYALVRFLPHSPNPHAIISSSLTIAAAGGLVLAAVFIGGLGVWSPALLPVRESPALAAGVAAGVALTAVAGLLASVYLSRKRAGFVLAQAAVFGTGKVVAAVMFAVMGLHAVGLVGAWVVGSGALAAVGLGVFLPRALDGQYRFRPMVAREVVNDMAHFAFANYVSAALWSAPTLLLPILITNLKGPETNAYYYVASNVGGLLVMIPTAIAMSLFAHGSHDATDLVRRAVEAGKVSLALLAPALVGVFLLGEKVLLIFGRAYSVEGTRLLWVLALSTLPLTVNFLYFSVRRVQQRMAGVVASTVWILVVTLGLSVVLLPRLGLPGAGVAWFAAQASVAAVILGRFALSR
ncbi:MAG: oligosaccharide flippase family protein [Armatimonadota bacterium]|nr:oligosaccharide flippase family protein [Armatimonadota bacterium]MDR7452039.1 oligosaccharide flippase family protein [Armatimonadota bacterium]MDR7467930.1 oligosaccharide flippase family protein [Armatimonadota bacterium]MDR7494217.1 oligosaccharide flippase family protein [Armatimonadota bacterium]MDR7559071.1 oligosaccharide flippase family protein [Armatimonadota bacterium]